MSIDDFPSLPRVGAPAHLPAAAPAQGARQARGPETPRFGDVLDLQEARAARSEPIPQEVLDDMTRAAALVERLAFEGRHVRFDTHRLSGQVVAGLCDADGAVVKELSLTDIVLGHIPDGAA